MFTGKSDIKSTFRLVPLLQGSWPWVIMMAQDPITKQWKFFMDKCLPFGVSISCSIFQRVSDALKHITQVKTNSVITNYMDDFLFLAITILLCNWLLKQFLKICEKIGIPIALDKTEWATEVIAFLGILLDGKNYVLSIPINKRDWAVRLLRLMLSKSQATIKALQALCGYLNFLGRAIYPGRVFTRWMYAK